MQTEVEDMEATVEKMQEDVSDHAQQLAVCNKQSEAEGRESENSKTFGQPLHAKTEELLAKHGTDRQGAFGGAIDGNDCRRLMAQAPSFIEEAVDHVIAKREWRAEGITDQDMQKAGEGHTQHLVAFDGLLSTLLTKRFHFTAEIGVLERTA